VQTHLKNIHLNSKTQNETLTFASLSNYHHFRQPWNIQTNRDSDGHGTCGPLYVGKQAVWPLLWKTQGSSRIQW